MAKMYLVVTVFLLLALMVGTSVEVNTQRQILESLLQGYDINEWPDMDWGRRTNIVVQLFINSFGSLNAANMDYSIDAFLRQRWRDPRLQYTVGRDSMTITDKAIVDRIWKPDTFFENVKDAKVHQVTMPNILLRLSKTGDILYSMRLTMTLSCYMEFEDYPFDSQECSISLSSYANTDDVIKYHWIEKDSIDTPDDLEIAQFDLMDTSTEEITYHYATGNFSGLRVHFTLRRQNGYHILQTYVPTILIVVISWVSFWLDPNAVPGRVTLGVTTLLTLTTLASGIRQQLPPVSYVKAIDVWVGMCMIMVFGALFEFTVVNWLANRKAGSGSTTLFKIPRILRGRQGEEGGKQQPSPQSPAAAEPAKPAATFISHARALDRLCRVAFPLSFIVFNAVYWPYYLMLQLN